ncbi:MAG: hypothetical protein KGI54_13120 [Pseudomonadota bacterium]|nr:hypothetical protein [Pseudomonadota bacterium]
MNKMIFAVIVAVIGLAGCAGIPMKDSNKVVGTSGYFMAYQGFFHQKYICSLVEPQSVCLHRSDYKLIDGFIKNDFWKGTLAMEMLVPKNINVHNGDILKFKNAHLVKQEVLNAQFAGVARTANKTDSSCQYKLSTLGTASNNFGKIQCNGWTPKKLENLMM